MSSRSNPDLPTTAEIAALTARLRELSHAGAAADADERARFLADKDALVARITAAAHHSDTRGAAGSSGDDWADYRTYSREEAAGELIARGVPPDQASGVVERYLDGLSWERGWSPQDQWEIDDDDLDVMLARSAVDAGPVAAEDDSTAQLGLNGGEGPPIDAGPALTVEEAAHELTADGRSLDEARALVRGYLDDVSHQIGASAHLWGLDDADLDAIRAGERAQTTAAVERAHDAVTALPTTVEDEAVRHNEPADEQADILVVEP